MHNFSDKPQCQYVKKFRASVSLNGEVVDILDIHDNIKACFSITVKFGKAILEEQINHSMIVIPVHGDVDSVGPFVYNPENNTVKTTIFTIDGKAQDFVASVDDLMNMNSMIFHPAHSCPPPKPPKPECDCKHDHKPGHGHFDEPFHPGHGDHHHHKPGDIVPPIHFKPEPGNDDKHCGGKPLCDPYVTQSELREESKRRQYTDNKIMDMIGNATTDSKSIYGHIDILTSNLKREEERSIHTDKIQNEKISKLEDDVNILRQQSNFKDAEIRKALNAEIDERKNAYTELYKIVNNVQNDGLKTLNELDKTNNEVRKETQRARSEERELRNLVKREEEERLISDKEIVNAIRIEETHRANGDKDLLSKIDAEYHRAKLNEEELAHDLHHHVDSLKHEAKAIDKRVSDLFHYTVDTYQTKGDYVEYTPGVTDTKNITLPNKSALMGKSVNNVGYPMIGMSADNTIEIGTQMVDLHLSGNQVRLQYNNTTLANTDDIADFVPYGVYSKLEDKVKALKEELEVTKMALNTLKDTVDGILSKIQN